MKKKNTIIGLTVAGLTATAGLVAVPPATATPTGAYDVYVAKRKVVKAFYRRSYSSQQSICFLWDTRPSKVVRILTKPVYENTPSSVSWYEARRGVITAMNQVC